MVEWPKVAGVALFCQIFLLLMDGNIEDLSATWKKVVKKMSFSWKKVVSLHRKR